MLCLLAVWSRSGSAVVCSKGTTCNGFLSYNIGAHNCISYEREQLPAGSPHFLTPKPGRRNLWHPLLDPTSPVKRPICLWKSLSSPPSHPGPSHTITSMHRSRAPPTECAETHPRSERQRPMNPFPQDVEMQRRVVLPVSVPLPLVHIRFHHLRAFHTVALGTSYTSGRTSQYSDPPMPTTNHSQAVRSKCTIVIHGAQ